MSPAIKALRRRYLIPVLVVLVIVIIFVLALILVYLCRANSNTQSGSNWTESIVLVYDLPNNLGSKTVVIRVEELNENDTNSLQQIFNTKLANNALTQDVRMEIIRAVTNNIKNQNFPGIILSMAPTVEITQKQPTNKFGQLPIEQRSSFNQTHVRLTKGESGHPKDTTSQLQIDIHAIFPSSCLITCRKYIVDEQFANIDIEIELYESIFVDATVQPTTDSTSINCIPDKSIDKLSLARVTLLNADELQFNNRNISLILQLSCPILDIYNYSISVNNTSFLNSTNTTSNVTNLDQFNTDLVTLSFVALDIYELPIFVSFDLYFGSISMPVRILFQNGTVAAGVLVRANLTDSPSVGQSGYTNENGTIIFTNVPLRTISLFARTINNQIAVTGIAPSSFGISLILIPFEDGISTNTTAISAKTYQNLDIKSSSKHFLRRITKRDIELPGFNVTTSGIQLQIVSKILMTEKNSTSVYVRYKFVTSELPGGYFGTMFNDYFTVIIRSEKGYYETISQSMNGLGIGAFNNFTGETDWYTLKLKVNEESELVRIDVGVANVADEFYQSSVIVDKIGVEGCDKCNDCDKCISDPFCRETCSNPPMRSCLFYTDCMEAKISCGTNGYAIEHGLKYCTKYTNRLRLFTSEGQYWIYETMNCLQKALVPLLKNCNNTCEILKQTAFASHPTCYIDAGACDLSALDWVHILNILGNDGLIESGLMPALQTKDDCISNIILNIQNAIEVVPFFQITKYLKTLYYFQSFQNDS